MISDLGSMLITVSIAAAVLSAVVGVILWVLLRVAPSPAQEHVRSGLIRWNKMTMGILDRGAYAWAVVMVVTFGFLLIGAIASIFLMR